MLRKLLLTLGLAAMTLGIAACNTVRGVGDDLKSAADTVDNAT